MNTPWRIEMFGGMRAQSGDLTLTRFRTQKTALLLARLAFFPRRTHPREELADALWPDADRDAGRNNLKQSLAILRRLLEPPGTPASGVLIADRAGVRLNPAAITTDVADFEAALRDAARLPDASARAQCLRQAGALYQGELLPGFYDDWVVEERERLDAAWDGAQKQIRGSVPAPTPSAPVPTAAPLSVAPRLLMTFTRFFGREQERTDLAALLGDESVRLVTLTGRAGRARHAWPSKRPAAPPPSWTGGPISSRWPTSPTRASSRAPLPTPWGCRAHPPGSRWTGSSPPCAPRPPCSSWTTWNNLGRGRRPPCSPC